MQATAEILENNRAKLSIKVDAQDFGSSIDQAIEQAAKTVRIPGFRPGRVPKQLVEARIGRAAIREEVIRESLPEFIRDAVIQTGVDAIATQTVDVISPDDAPNFEVDVVVETRPRVSIAGYQGLSVKIESPIPTQEEIDREIDKLRNQFAKLSQVDRPSKVGDSVTMNIKASRNDEVLENYCIDDYVSEVGSKMLFEQLDDLMVGVKPGDIVKANSTVPGEEQEVTFEVLVKQVDEKILPEPTDEWVASASEFDKFEDLKSDIFEKLSKAKADFAIEEFRRGAAQALCELVTDEIPKSLISQEIQTRLHDFQHRLDAQKIPLGLYLQATGQSEESFISTITSVAHETVRLDLALRALSQAEGIEVTDADVDSHLGKLAESAGETLDAARENLEKGGLMEGFRLEIKKAKSLEWLEDNVRVLDQDGKPVTLRVQRGDDEVVVGSKAQ